MTSLTRRASTLQEKSTYDTFTNECSADKAKAGHGAEVKGFTIEEAIEHIGFGWVQIRIGLMSGFAWTADGMEIMVLSILGPILFCEWNITKAEEAFITTVVFIGSLFGASIFGRWADKYGRRNILMLGAVWVLYFGLLSAGVPNLPWLLVIRALVGFGIGSGAQAITYYAEFLPIKWRGKLLILPEFLWAIGGMLEAVLALLLMKYGWRIWLMATAAPMLPCAIFYIILPTSPRYDLACGRVDEAYKTLEKLAMYNGKTLPPGKLLPTEVKQLGVAKDLLAPSFKLTSVLLAISWFCSAFIYYGLILFTTDFIKMGSTCWGRDAEDRLSTGGLHFTCFAGCNTLTDSDYVKLIWTSAAELPGLALTAILIDRLGRKMTMILENLLFAISCVCLSICMGSIPMLFFLFACRALAASTLQTMYIYTPEVYPTEIRALSVGIGCGFGRVGALVTPYIAQVLLQWSQYAGLTVYTVVGLLAAFIAFLLPIETKGNDMAGVVFRLEQTLLKERGNPIHKQKCQ